MKKRLIKALCANSLAIADNTTSIVLPSIEIKGKQVPDTPKEMIKVGVNYKIGSFSINPLIKYIGQRYGDIENTESVNSYVLLDLQATYKIPNFAFIKDSSFNITCYNLTDETYIGKINTSDFQLNGSSGYYQGVPLSIAAALDMRF